MKTLARKRETLMALAAAQREEIAAQLNRHRDLAEWVQAGFAIYRKVARHKFLLIAGVVGLTAARPRLVLRLGGYAWTAFKLIRSIQRMIRKEKLAHLSLGPK